MNADGEYSVATDWATNVGFVCPDEFSESWPLKKGTGLRQGNFAMLGFPYGLVK